MAPAISAAECRNLRGLGRLSGTIGPQHIPFGQLLSFAVSETLISGVIPPDLNYCSAADLKETATNAIEKAFASVENTTVPSGPTASPSTLPFLMW